MGTELRTPSHAASWVFGLLGTSMLYVLGAGPMEYWEVRNAMGSSGTQPPAWVVRAFHPAVLLCQERPLSMMMEPYIGWWVRKGAEKS